MISLKEKVLVKQMFWAGKGAGAGGTYSSGNTAAVTGSAIDTLGATEALFKLVATGKGNKKSFTVSIREGTTSTGGTAGFTAITNGVGDSTSASFSAITLASGTTTQGVLRLKLDENRKRYLKAYIVGATGCLYQAGLTVLLGGFRTVQPVSQTALTTAT